MAAQQPVNGNSGNGSFSLFPNPNISRPVAPVIRLHPNPRPKRSESRERARQEQLQQLQQNHPQERPRTPQTQLSHLESLQPAPRQESSVQRSHTPLQFNPVDGSVNPSPSQVEQLQPVADIPGRKEATSPEADTLVRSSSSRSRSSIAKLPLDGPSSSGLSTRPPPLRSIFPTYDPDLPLDQQAYGPTQMSPSHIPRAVISRQSYYDNDATSIGASQAYSSRPLPQQLGQQQHQQPRSPPTRHQQQDTLAFSSANRAPIRANTLSPPVIPKTSTTDELKTFWKAANGWKAAPSEGRLFCLKLTQLKDAPVYTLSSASQPLYSLRLDPTSASALVSLSRHDPNKAYKPPKADVPSSSSSSPGLSVGTNSKSDSKHWQQVLHTTLEEESRKHPPNDGLVALLMPDPATKMAIERSDEPALVAMAERECARLVWDEDSLSNYLVHPALAAPFCITIERCPAWSRVEYTLEHHESPRHLAKLTRDGTGGGWLEIDTSVASHIEAYYIIDVAVAALLIVGASDERSGNGPVVNAARGAVGAGMMETFEPPPGPVESATRSESLNVGRFSKLSVRKDDRKQRRQMEEFEIDLESQDGSLTKAGTRTRTKSKRKSNENEKEDKLPFLLRAGVKLTKGVFKFVIWILTAIFRVLFKCVRSKY